MFLMHRLLTVYQGPMGAVTNENIMDSLGLMGKGMLGIFVVMGLIWLVIFCLNRFTGNGGAGRDSDK